MKINTGQGTISLLTLVAIWSISLTVNLPGLAISPILGDMQKIFPDTSELKTQLLTILPNLFIIPFVLLSGTLSVLRSKKPILAVALFIYAAGGLACFFASTLTRLIIMSCVIGIGCGLVIPLAAGLLSDFFTGKYRMQQLGIKSGIANMSLVIATLSVGFLGAKDWHLPFAVYLTPIIPLVLLPFIRGAKKEKVLQEKNTAAAGTIDIKKLTGISLLYGFITYSITVFSYYLPFLAVTDKISNSALGVVTACFFMAIMLPGFFLPQIIHFFRQFTNLISLLCIAAGLILVTAFQNEWGWIAAAVCAGFGYGVMQPIIYDKAVQTATGRKSTLALSIVFAMNYAAVSLSPFIMKAFQQLFQTKSNEFPFIINFVLILGVFIGGYIDRTSFTIRINKEYV